MAVKPWKVAIEPDMSCRIFDDVGEEVRQYSGFTELAQAHAKALRTIRRLRRCSWPDRVDTFEAILQHQNEVVVEAPEEQVDSNEPPPY